MSVPTVEREEGLWELYLNFCRARELRPSMKDFAQWLDDQDYDLDEPDWNGFVSE